MSLLIPVYIIFGLLLLAIISIIHSYFTATQIDLDVLLIETIVNDFKEIEIPKTTSLSKSAVEKHIKKLNEYYDYIPRRIAREVFFPYMVTELTTERDGVYEVHFKSYRRIHPSINQYRTEIETHVNNLIKDFGYYGKNPRSLIVTDMLRISIMDDY